MAVDGSLIFDTKIDTNGFKKDTNTIKSQASGLKSTFMSLGKTIGIAFGVAQLIKFGKQAIDTASDLQEVQNVVDTAFGEMAFKMEEFADTAIDSFGISKLAAKQTGSTFMAMARGMGIAMDNSSDMAVSLTGLSADMASFYNISQDVASTALKSVFTGETETLKQFGIVMTEVNLQNFAYSQGIKTKISAMSQAEKVQLRYNYVMQQTALAQGDFARTSDSWANQTRVLSERWKEFLGILGSGLITVLTPVVKFLNTAMSYLISFATTASKVLSTFFNIKTASSDASSKIAGIADSSESASSGIEGIGSSAEKAAKKAKKSTAGIDDLSILTKDVAENAEGASDALGNMGGGGNYGMDVTPVVNEAETSRFEKSISALAETIKKQAQIAAKSFMSGFQEGLGEINLDSINGHIEGIKKSLKDIFTDPTVQKAANDWVINTANSLGKIAGSMASIGLTCAEFFVGSLDTYLDQNKEFIKEKIISLFDISAKRTEIQANFAVAVADIFTVFRGNDAKQIGADLIAIFTNSFLSLAELGATFGTDLVGAITKPITENKETIKTALENSLGTISVVVGGIKDFLDNTFKAIKTSYDTYITPALEKFGSGFSTVFSAVLEAYNTYLAPVIKNISEKFRELVNGPIAELIQSFTDYVGLMVDGIATVWNVTLAPFLAWIIKKFAPLIGKYITDIGNFYIGLYTTIAKVVSNILKALGGITEFLVGVFTGDWEKAWNGIKTFFTGIINAIKELVRPIGKFFTDKFKLAWDGVQTAFSTTKTFFTGVLNGIKTVFKNIPTWFQTKFTEAWSNVKKVFSTGSKIFDGIKEGIASTFKTVVNGLIGGINKVIAVPFNKINSMLNAIRNVGIAGVKPFSGLWDKNPISVPSIPKLATGTVVPANYGEFMAILGDNKRETEVVSPLSTLKQAMKEVLKETGGSNNGNITIQCILDGRILFEDMVKQNNKNTRLTGKNALAY